MVFSGFSQLSRNFLANFQEGARKRLNRAENRGGLGTIRDDLGSYSKVLKTDCPNLFWGSNICFLLELFTFLWYNVSTSLGLNIFIGVCFLKNTNTLEIVL